MLPESWSLSLETGQEDAANDPELNSEELDAGILNGEPLTPELSLSDCDFTGPWGTRSRPSFSI